jgi:hypothetical protein
MAYTRAETFLNLTLDKYSRSNSHTYLLTPREETPSIFTEQRVCEEQSQQGSLRKKEKPFSPRETNHDTSVVYPPTHFTYRLSYLCYLCAMGEKKKTVPVAARNVRFMSPDIPAKV